MGDEPEGLRFVPGRPRVRAEPSVEQREAGPEPGVFQIEVEPVEGVGTRKCLVDDRGSRQRGKIEFFVDSPLRLLRADGLLRRVQQPVEGRVGAAVPGAPDDRVLHRGHRTAPLLPQNRAVDGNVAVADDLQPEKSERALENLERQVHPLLRTRHE